MAKTSKTVFIVVAAVICVIALLFAAKFIKKTNNALSNEFNAVSEYYKALDLPTNAEGVTARSILIHIDDIKDGHLVATTYRNNKDFFSNRLVWVKFEGENLQDRVRDLEALRGKLIGTEQTIAYFTIDEKSSPQVIIAYDILSLDEDSKGNS